MLYLFPTGSILKGLNIRPSLKDTATAKCITVFRYLFQWINLAFSCWYFIILPYINIATIIYSQVKYDILQKENVNSHQILPVWHVYLLILTYLDLAARTSGRRGDLEASKLQCVIYGLTTGPCTAVLFFKKGRKGR